MSMSVSALAGSTGPQMMSGASTRMPASQKMSNLFDNIDTSGSGTITQAQFNQAFQTLNPPKDFKSLGASAIWSQLDPTNSGTVNKQDFVTAMTSMMKQMRGHHHHSSSQTPNSAQSPAQTIAASDNTLTSSTTGNQINTLV
jgi:Ca2+-binding EF-hand superfamily protein